MQLVESFPSLAVFDDSASTRERHCVDAQILLLRCFARSQNGEVSTHSCFSSGATSSLELVE